MKNRLFALVLASVIGLSLMGLLLGVQVQGAELMTVLPPLDRTNSVNSLTDGSPVCDTLTDPMERDLCHFVTSVYPEGLLTNWPNPGLPGHFDHTPMRDYTETLKQEAISESASMLALYAALIGDKTTFDYLFDVSAPAEIGGTGAPMSGTQESPYYFASPNLCLLHWILDKDGYKEDSGSGRLASAGGEASRWLEALSIAEQKFPDPRYRLFANCLAWGLMGATDFNAGAVGHFEDPGTAEAFDDYLLRPHFGWRDDFSSFATTTATNLSYNDLMGWLYAAQLGQEPRQTAYASDYSLSASYLFTDFYSKVLSYTTPKMTDSITQCGTDLPLVMYDIKRHFYYSETLPSNLVCSATVTVTASSTEIQRPDLVPGNAADCDSLTRWSSEPNDDEWIALEFSEPITINTAVLRWEDAFGASYNIDISDNGITWTTIYTETNGDGKDDRILFPLTTTRHIRMRGLSRGTQWGYSLFEFEVYLSGTSSWTALDLARRAAVYARVSGDTAAWETGRRILNWYKEQYFDSGIAAAYDPCTGEPLPGWEYGDVPSIMADLAELAAEYCDLDFAYQVIDEKLRPKVITDPADPLYGSVGPSAFENLEVLLALRHVAERSCLYLPIILEDG